MGCTSEQSDCGSNEKPVHRVTVSDFYMGKYEVTQKQWREVMGASATLSTRSNDNNSTSGNDNNSTSSNDEISNPSLSTCTFVWSGHIVLFKIVLYY
jgi:formylglycine-generating enzyme required for sulfatase activity